MKNYLHLLLFSFIFLFTSCKKEVQKEIKKSAINTSIKLAQGFEIEGFKDYKKLIIKAPYKDSKIQYEYTLVSSTTDLSKFTETDKIIQIPIEKIVVTSTTHIPMLELLGVE